MPKDIFYDSDADLSLLQGKTVAILGNRRRRRPAFGLL
jgi:ketol-acid reductoisomerase